MGYDFIDYEPLLFQFNELADNALRRIIALSREFITRLILKFDGHNISYYILTFHVLLIMSINISKYITEVEKLMSEVIRSANDKNLRIETVDDSDIINKLLNGTYQLSKELGTEIYNEIKEKEGN